MLMTRTMLAILFCGLPVCSMAADAGRLSYLEQEVRNLQRQVQALSRQVDELTARPDRLTARTSAPAPKARVASDAWINAANWQKVRPGMNELDVIGLLGPPTSMREENGARVLRYTLEIGVGGFLTGSVTLRDRAVAEVRHPELR
jgi:hypothetical protein